MPSTNTDTPAHPRTIPSNKMTTHEWRRPGATFWYTVGYGNPDCPGTTLWSEEASSNKCSDAPTLAASYAWVAGQNTMIHTWVEADFCTNYGSGRSVFVTQNAITVGGDTGKHGCVNNAAVGGYEVVLL